MSGVEHGRWKLVRSRSATSQVWGGRINASVQPSPARTARPTLRDDSSARTVVDEAHVTVRPGSASASETATAVASGTAKCSASVWCLLRSSHSTGWNVPSPACSVTGHTAAPFALMAATSSSVKWRQAAGAVTAPRWRAKTLWKRSRSSGSAGRRRYGGMGVSPMASIRA